jgi:hypothetical protein
MKVRRIVVIEVHRDHEPEKATDRWHEHMVAARPVAIGSPGRRTHFCNHVPGAADARIWHIATA